MNFEKIILNSNHKVNEFFVTRYLAFIAAIADKNADNKDIEIHHILPKAIFKEYKNLKKHTENAIKLTYREHYLAHFMLHKAFGSSQTSAFMAMCNKNADRHNLKINSTLYESTKKVNNKRIAEINSVNYYHNLATGEELRLAKDEIAPAGFVRGRIYSRLHIYNLKTNEEKSIVFKKNEKTPEMPSGWAKGTPSQSNRMKSKRTIYNLTTNETKKISSTDTVSAGWMLGSPNTKKAMSKRIAISKNDVTRYIKENESIPAGWLLGTATVQCPHCLKIGKSAGMKHSHFDNCKYRKT